MSMFEDIYSVVKTVPKGKVASYGLIARLAGHPRAARRVGHALHQNPNPAAIPCHRIVFKDGKLSEAFAFGGINKQRQLLESEGVGFIGDKVDMINFSLDF